MSHSTKENPRWAAAHYWVAVPLWLFTHKRWAAWLYDKTEELAWPDTRGK